MLNAVEMFGVQRSEADGASRGTAEPPGLPPVSTRRPLRKAKPSVDVHVRSPQSARYRSVPPMFVLFITCNECGQLPVVESEALCSMICAPTAPRAESGNAHAAVSALNATT